jgi:HD-GYP domain-containing protein (c-di-GMP phosphodiesterase class II)
MDESDIDRHLLGEEIPVSTDSLVGFVALSGQVMNIPDTHRLPEGAPFRISRYLDARTGYCADNILAIPLRCPDGEQIGVLELFNHQDADGRQFPFGDDALEAVTTLASTAAIALHNSRLQEHLREAHLDTILCLSTVAEYRDSDTAQHIQRVSRGSELVAAALGASADQVSLVRYASPMHDVGKVAIPDAILLKPGHLTADQRKVVERHTQIGAEILGSADAPVLAAAREIALWHHEHWDGQGYPHGLKGTDIPLRARIVGLMDVFDAVVSRRCYKEACSLDTALAILQEDSGKHFDPDAVRAFISALPEVLKSYPALKAA